jgi:nucleoside-diphosphate-sugar epimerase
VRILIIGGTRSVGPAAARRLAAAGHELAVFHRGEHEGDLPASVTHFRSPAATMPVRTIPDELRAFEPEIVLHMIAMGEADALAAVRAFAGVARRIVAASSGDVYRAFAIFRGTEEGPADPAPLGEHAPLRDRLFPYREPDTPAEALAHDYDKILMERAIASDPRLPATILRFPKIYGPGDNAGLATVYGFRHRPQWRWTHGFAANVGAAVALAVADGRAAGRTYNVGEAHTPTMAERLARLPPNESVPLHEGAFNYAQDIVYDTGAIRGELGFAEEVDETEAMLATARAAAGPG